MKSLWVNFFVCQEGCYADAQGRLFTTLDNNLFLVLQAVEEIEPGTLDRVDKILDRLDGTVDKVLDLGMSAR